MSKEDNLINESDMLNSDKLIKDMNILKHINNYALIGFRRLNEISTSDIAFLSDANQKRIYIARLIYMNIISEIEKAKTIEQLKEFDFKECVHSIKIYDSIKSLCEKINSVVGDAANVKMKFNSDNEKDIRVLSDYSVLRFIFLNIVSLLAMNIEKKKKIINVEVKRNPESNKVSINIWNKFSFRIKDKVTDINKAFEMYSSDYDFEQTINIGKALAKLMDGDVSYFLDGDVLKVFISIPEFIQESELDIKLMEKPDYEATDKISILSTFSSVLIESFIENDSKIMDISEFFNI